MLRIVVEVDPRDACVSERTRDEAGMFENDRAHARVSLA
jgi:hypothetical protein